MNLAEVITQLQVDVTRREDRAFVKALALVQACEVHFEVVGCTDPRLIGLQGAPVCPARIPVFGSSENATEEEREAWLAGFVPTTWCSATGRLTPGLPGWRAAEAVERDVGKAIWWNDFSTLRSGIFGRYGDPHAFALLLHELGHVVCADLEGKAYYTSRARQPMATPPPDVALRYEPAAPGLAHETVATRWARRASQALFGRQSFEDEHMRRWDATANEYLSALFFDCEPQPSADTIRRAQEISCACLPSP